MIFILSALALIPPAASAKPSNAYGEWIIHAAADMEQWETAGIENAIIGNSGATFNLSGQAAFYRPLPSGFHKNVDAMQVYLHIPHGYENAFVKEAALLFLTLDGGGNIAKRLRIVLADSSNTDDVYVPLFSYKNDMKDADIVAIALNGNADGVRFGGVRLLRYSALDKIKSAWKSFWVFEPFTPHTINIMTGPVITKDPKDTGWHENRHLAATSVNAYIFAGLSLAGVFLLVSGIFKPNRKSGISAITRKFFVIIAAVWLVYDLRMGMEFIRNVAADHMQYMAAAPAERTFRDRGRFYDFARFVQPFVKEEKTYELFLPDPWPFFGMMRYYTYPSAPNPGQPASDVWVIYDRDDITIGDDNRLYHAGSPFTGTGKLLGAFDKNSFVFRGMPKETNASRQLSKTIYSD